MGQVEVKRGHLPALIFEAYTVERVDEHLEAMRQRRTEARDNLTPSSLELIRATTKAINGLLDLRGEIARRDRAAAGSRVEEVPDA